MEYNAIYLWVICFYVHNINLLYQALNENKKALLTTFSQTMDNIRMHSHNPAGRYV